MMCRYRNSAAHSFRSATDGIYDIGKDKGKKKIKKKNTGRIEFTTFIYFYFYFFFFTSRRSNIIANGMHTYTLTRRTSHGRDMRWKKKNAKRTYKI
jgi:hypothetical protein